MNDKKYHKNGNKCCRYKIFSYFCRRKKEYNINVIAEKKLFNNTTYE